MRLNLWVRLKPAPTISARVMPHAFGRNRVMPPKRAAGMCVIATYGGVFRQVALTACDARPAIAAKPIRSGALADWGVAMTLAQDAFLPGF
jgi:hypothetical protein